MASTRTLKRRRQRLARKILALDPRPFLPRDTMSEMTLAACRDVILDNLRDHTTLLRFLEGTNTVEGHPIRIITRQTTQHG